VTLLNFVWHFHQPDYRHPVTGQPVLPWVRLHAVKGYLDLLTALDAAENAHVCVNFSGVLLNQLAAYANTGLPDRWGELSALPAGQLDEDARQVVMANFFSAHTENLIRPHTRYWELKEKCTELARQDVDGAGSGLSDKELTDLIVWFNLAWIGFTGQRRKDVRELINRGRGYSHEDQLQVLCIHRELAAMALPGYRALAEAGRIELSTTPFNHPILPLVIDLAEGTLNPGDPLPEFHYPQDARRQVHLAQESFAAAFGQHPRGMWPAEGSVSDAALEIFSEAGLSWVATDQSNLPHGGHLTHLMPWRWEREDQAIHVFFRDTRLADNIGFEYARWQPRVAGQHLVQMARMLGEQHGDLSVITIALDGENPWENYAEGGEHFLAAMFAAIKAHPTMDCVTPSEVVQRQEWPSMNHVHSGSWVSGNFDIWSRHADTRRAWRLMAQARAELDSHMSDPAIEHHVLAAESSDWFWWYGDDFVSSQQWQFDELFRGHLIAAYEKAGLDVPGPLYGPIISQQEQPVSKITHRLDPVLDGRVTSFYEWRHAKEIDLAGTQGSMARTNGNDKLRALYGYSADKLWLRIDLPPEWRGRADVALNLALELTLEQRTQSFALSRDTSVVNSKMAVGAILELALPLEAISVGAGLAELVIGIQWDSEWLRLPHSGKATIQLLDTAGAAALWTV
jgi:alpha-amylase/alpha-mannosidase (GH57 family)